MKPIGWLLLGGLLALAALAQNTRGVRVRGAFEVLILDEQSRRVALLSGQGAQGVGNRVPLNVARLDYFGERGLTNLSVIGTNCVYDAGEQTVTSPDPLKIVTADEQLQIEGQGFTWWRTNNHLVISNDVTTRLLRPPVGTNAPVPLFIRAGRLELFYHANEVAYSRSVQVEDPALHLHCAEFTVYGALTGGVQRLVARGSVELVNHADGGRATCSEATYHHTPEGEVIELTGDPQWSDGGRSGSADRITLYQTARRILALGQARLTLPRTGGDVTGLMGLGFAPPAKSANETTNRLIEVLAGTLEIELPPTNGPARRIVATTNVVIRDPAVPGGATAGRAEYQAPGRLDLTGNPVWSSAGTEVRAEWLSFNALRQMASALTNAVVRLPVARLRERFFGDTNAAPATLTNEVIEIRSDFATYQDTTLRFGEQVRAVFLSRDDQLGELTCRSLGITYSNRVQAIRATGAVVAEQFPLLREDGREIRRRLRGETFAVTFTPQETIESVLAEGDVTALQEERTGGTNVVRKELLAQQAAAWFGPTNHLRSARASGNVVFVAGHRSVTGETAVYSDDDGLARLTGNPVALLPEGRVSGAEEFIWDSRSNRYRVKGAFRSQWTQIPGLTNLPKLLIGN